MLPEIEIGARRCGRENRLAIVDQFVWKQINRCENAEYRQHAKECREDSPDAALIKTFHRKARARDLGKNNRADQITGDYKENVDPHKSTRKFRYLQVKCKHTQDRNSSEPVDVFPIL